MNVLIRHLRPLGISLTVLILTAGIAFAAKPTNPGNGHGQGQTVTTTTETSETDTETSETETETSDTETSDVTTETTTTESSDTGSNCTVDPTTATPAVLAGLSHGQIVCWAAHQPTPAGYANHGAWVSHWAKMNHGHHT